MAKMTGPMGPPDQPLTRNTPLGGTVPSLGNPEMLRAIDALLKNYQAWQTSSLLGTLLTAINSLGDQTYDGLVAALELQLSDISDAGSLAALDEVTFSNLAAALQTPLTEQADSVWQAGTGTTPSIVAPDAIAAAITALGGGGGWAEEATAVADGTTEYLQVTSTQSTLSDIVRMQCMFRDLVPEIDGDTVSFTVILDDDSEHTTFDGQFMAENDAAFTEGDFSSAAISFGGLGTGSGEYFNCILTLLSGNGSIAKKYIRLDRYQKTSAGVDAWLTYILQLNTTKSIKGFRFDTNNAGDMIDAGDAFLFVQAS